METSKSLRAPDTKKLKINVIVEQPETDEDIDSVQEFIGKAYTNAAISIIQRTFEDAEDRRKCFSFLIELKEKDIII